MDCQSRQKTDRNILSQIQLFVTDVDGVLTDGTIWWAGDQDWRRRYSIIDGMGIKRLQKNNIPVAVITASNSDDVRARVSYLKIDHFYEKEFDKIKALEDLEKKTGISRDKMSYIGDDLMDIPVIEEVGFGVSVPNALQQVKSAAKYITSKPGGSGGVREVCEMILSAKGLV